VYGEEMKQGETSLPIKINPCPIKEAVFQIKFDMPEIYPEIFYSQILLLFRNENPDKTAIRADHSGIPDELRNKNPHIKYLPDFVYDFAPYQFEFGRNTLIWKLKSEYLGFSDWQAFIQSKNRQLMDIIREAENVSFGLRYINLLPLYDLSATNIQLLFDGKEYFRKNVNVRYLDMIDAYRTNVQIASTANDLYIDIDIILEKISEKISSELLSEKLEEMHQIEKKIFFDLLKKEITDHDLSAEY
jgi:uncharacterized protein (TIGR04255 family)